MTIIIALFYLSLATIIGMLAWKSFALRDLKLSPALGVEEELHGRLYELMYHGWHAFRVKVLLRSWQYLVRMFFVAARAVLHWTGVWGAKLRTKHQKWFDMVEGRGSLHKRGAVSLYLRDIAEHKKRLTANN